MANVYDKKLVLMLVDAWIMLFKSIFIFDGENNSRMHGWMLGRMLVFFKEINVMPGLTRSTGVVTLNEKVAMP